MKKLFLLSLATCLTLIGCVQIPGNSGGTDIGTSQSQSVPEGNSGEAGTASSQSQSVPEGNSGEAGTTSSQSQNVPEGYHLVTFNSNGGSPVESQTVRDGGKVSKPEDPIRPGYDFINWTYCDEEWSFIGYSVTEDMTLDANWSAIDYNITYVLNGGTNDPLNPSVFSAESKDLSLRDPTRLGYSFLGWKLDGETVSSIDPYWSRDVILEATWVPSEGNEDILDFDIEVNGDRVVATKYHGNKANVAVPSVVTSIGDRAFSDCSSLVSVVIPDSVTSIGNYAFSHCTSLVSVTIGAGVTSISYFAFDECYRLAEVINLSPLDISKRSQKYGGVGYRALGVISSASESKLHMGQDGIVTYADGPSVTLVGYFGGRGDVTIPDSVTSIGNYAFYGCASLVSVTISDSVTSIGNCAFYGCASLASVVIPDSVTSIGFATFYDCASLVSTVIPDSVTSIGDRAFSDCSSLVSVVIPDSVASIGDYAFSCCTSLVSATIGAGVTSIGSGAFSRCTSLVSMVIPDSVTFIGNNAFWGCSLVSVTIGAGVTSILDLAFDECYRLAEVINLSSLDISKGSAEYGYVGYYALGVISSASESKLHMGQDGIATYEDGPSLTLVGYFGGSRDVTIPDSITSIGSGAFNYCTSLTSIVIPDSVTSIGNNAFSNCSSLVSVVIPDSVTSISEHAFSHCTSLVSMVIPDSVTSIDGFAFWGCASLVSVAIPDSVTSIKNYAFSDCSSLTSVTIPSSVTSIEKRAFSNCPSLVSVVIPDSVFFIDDYAFESCPLLQVFYVGTNEQWKSIWGYDVVSDKIVYYYSETEPTNDGRYWHYVDGVPTPWSR